MITTRTIIERWLPLVAQQKSSRHNNTNRYCSIGAEQVIKLVWPLLQRCNLITRIHNVYRYWNTLRWHLSVLRPRKPGLLRTRSRHSSFPFSCRLTLYFSSLERSIHRGTSFQLQQNLINIEYDQYRKHAILWRCKNLGICFLLNFLFVLPDIFKCHAVPIVHPDKCLSVTQKKNIMDCLENKIIFFYWAFCK